MYYQNNNDNREGRICLFNSYACSVEGLAKFYNWYWSYQVAITQNEVSSYVRYFKEFLKLQIFAINPSEKSFEIFDLNTWTVLGGLLNKSMNDRFKEFYRPKSS